MPAILVPVDGSVHAMKALRIAGDLSEKTAAGSYCCTYSFPTARRDGSWRFPSRTDCRRRSSPTYKRPAARNAFQKQRYGRSASESSRMQTPGRVGAAWRPRVMPIEQGDPVESILIAARHARANTIVMGCRGPERCGIAGLWQRLKTGVPEGGLYLHLGKVNAYGRSRRLQSDFHSYAGSSSWLYWPATAVPTEAQKRPKGQAERTNPGGSHSMKYTMKLVLTVVATVLMGVVAHTAKAADTIKLGLIEPLSGRIAAVGKDALDAFTFAAEQVNKRGGVLNGHPDRDHRPRQRHERGKDHREAEEGGRYGSVAMSFRG